MNLDKCVLAAITINPKKVPSGLSVFHCDSKEEMNTMAKNLEAILDGIAHELTEEIYIIVRH
ncbi:capping complex subunit for YIEGIA [Aeribacillus pallidus]|jgi:hypothetical protein|uniref:capping complex subunit for YIEGIA n=1 Tax=Aeribacillus pallidus TaxID=33936 RepID=UPI001DC02626|nr:hypothetical protein [Bacillus sp. (in: firmicutes)]